MAADQASSGSRALDRLLDIESPMPADRPPYYFDEHGDLLDALERNHVAAVMGREDKVSIYSRAKAAIEQLDRSLLAMRQALVRSTREMAKVSAQLNRLREANAASIRKQSQLEDDLQIAGERLGELSNAADFPEDFPAED